MKYIVVNSVKDGNRFLRKENKQKNNTTYNVKCVHLSYFAKEIVTKHMAKQGSMKALDVLDSTSGAVLLLEILGAKMEKDYFVPAESLSQETAQEIWNILQQLRMGETTAAYVENETALLLQIKNLIKEYEQALEKREQYDTARLYKQAIQILESKEIDMSKRQDTFVISDVCKSEFTAVENYFWNLYTDGNYTVYAVSESEQLPSENVLEGAEFFKAYGMANEVGYVISQILEKEQALGDVEVFYTAAEYEPYIEAAFSGRRIPYAMTNRQIPVDNVYLHMMKYILKWALDNYSYKSLKPAMLMSGKYRTMFYTEIREGIGWGKERYAAYIQKEKDNEKKQEFCNCLEQLIQVFDWAQEKEIPYVVIYWRLVSAARELIGKHADYKFIANPLKAFARQLKHLDTGKDMQEVIAVLSKELQSFTYDDIETSNMVCIRKLDTKVHILERKHIYVLGMSNTHFSGAAVESPVLSDEELECFLDQEKGYVRLAKDQEEKKKQALHATLASRDKNGTLYIGYCCYDTVNLRSMSPSVPYIRLMQNAGISENDVKYAGYENVILNNIIYSENAVWQDSEESDTEEGEIAVEEDAEENVIASPITSWSTTSLQQLLACPLQFYYNRVLRLPDENYKEPQPDLWLPASEKGTLAHGVMEDYCNAIFLNKAANEIPPMVQEELFEEIVNSRIQKMLELCPYTSKAAFEIECELIRKNCRNYLEKMHVEFSDPANQWVVVACEEDFEDVTLEFKAEDDIAYLSFRGQMDRLDCYVDETGVHHYRIMDYKSGGAKRHEIDIEDNRSIQHVVYKLALEAMKGKTESMVVDQVSFLHFFEENPQKQEITLSGAQIADFPYSVHELVLHVLKNGAYEKYCSGDEQKDSNNNACRYCTYQDICKEYIGEKL